MRSGGDKRGNRPFAAPLDLTSIDDRTKERFWIRVDVRGADECWEWNAFRDRDGYGRFCLTTKTGISASRVSLAMIMPLERGEVACHSCDNPPCVNPAHLFKGTQRDNGLDCVAKGRKNPVRGEGVASHKLTAAQVRAIRSERHRYGIYRELGRIYGVSDVTIRNIRLGKNWGSVA